MTRFLASVTSVAEAETALAGGADIVDCKDPGQGALGALPPQTVGAIVRAVGGRRPVSAVTGDLPMLPDVVVNAAQEMAATGVDYIKAGLFAGEGRPACISARPQVPRACPRSSRRSRVERPLHDFAARSESAMASPALSPSISMLAEAII